MTTHRILLATSIGDGVAAVCSSATTPSGGTGRVVGKFSSGFYIESATGLFAVGGPSIPAGPIHLVLESSPPLPPEGSIVHLGAECLWTDAGTIVLSRVVRYRPYLPSPAQLHEIGPVLARLGRLVSVPGDAAHVWTAVEDAIGRMNLHVARQLLQGVGSGLTPTGDDVLAGLVLFVRWAKPLSTLPAEVAERAATTHLSRCFLKWAAQGQSIQPIHDLIDAARSLASPRGASGTRDAQHRFERAVGTAASVGSTSGNAMLSGLALAATAWPMTSQQRMPSYAN
jgi:hypothetical protein